MKDDSISEETTSQDDPQDSGVKVYASLKSLAVNGTSPEIGDEVDLTVKGTVNSIDGDVACVSPTEVNGEPAPDAPMDDSGGDDMGAMRDKLMSQAQQEDGGGY